MAADCEKLKRVACDAIDAKLKDLHEVHVDVNYIIAFFN